MRLSPNDVRHLLDALCDDYHHEIAYKLSRHIQALEESERRLKSRFGDPADGSGPPRRRRSLP